MRKNNVARVTLDPDSAVVLRDRRSFGYELRFEALLAAARRVTRAIDDGVKSLTTDCPSAGARL
jgi:hypothetical protein